LRELVAYGVKQRRHLDRLLACAVVGRPLGLMAPVGREILTGMAEDLGTVNPDLWTLQGALEPLHNTPFIVLPVHPRRPLVCFDDRLAPTGQDAPVHRDVRGERLPLGAPGRRDDCQSLHDRLNAGLAAE
jgi:hypothetical protein